MNVYNPTDQVERAIQNANYKFNDRWLSESDCKLVAKSIKYLNRFKPEWLENVHLLDTRIEYMFAPYMSKHKSQMVFVTHLLFLRDIFENKKINSYLHSPITLVSRPIAHYLFREYPVRIYLNMDLIKPLNNSFVNIGGLAISDSDVSISLESIVDVKIDEEHVGLSKINKICGDLEYKTAVSMIAPGVFKNDSDKRAVLPDTEVWNKITRKKGIINRVDPGENGMIEVSYIDESPSFVTQTNFDKEFVVI